MGRRRPRRRSSTDEDEQVNQASALWARPKSEITEEQYQEFYKHVAHDFEPPLAYSHAKVEGPPRVHAAAVHPAAGAVRSLGPRTPPRHQALRPPGVHHGRRRAADAGVSAVRPRRDRLERPAAQRLARDPAAFGGRRADPHGVGQARARACSTTWRRISRSKYATFWKEFGRAFKEGVVEDAGNKDRIAKLLRFASTHDEPADAGGLAGRLCRPDEAGAGRHLLHHRRRLLGGEEQPAPRGVPEARRRSAADVRPRRRMGRLEPDRVRRQAAAVGRQRRPRSRRSSGRRAREAGERGAGRRVQGPARADPGGARRAGQRGPRRPTG